MGAERARERAEEKESAGSWPSRLAAPLGELAEALRRVYWFPSARVSSERGALERRGGERREGEKQEQEQPSIEKLLPSQSQSPPDERTLQGRPLATMKPFLRIEPACGCFSERVVLIKRNDR